MGSARQPKAETEVKRSAGRRTVAAPAHGVAGPHSPTGVLALQRAIGNRAARRVVQRRLDVGPAGDRFEQEADRIADDVMRARAGTRAVRGDGARVSRSVADDTIGLEGGPASPETEAAIQRQRGHGAALPDPLRSAMEASFGADFSAVRIHAGPAADELNRSMQARAFTVGHDIFFSEGAYRPRTASGQRLLAHELAHTVQQGAVEIDGS